jgi:hypothetical protein
MNMRIQMEHVKLAIPHAKPVPGLQHFAQNA